MEDARVASPREELIAMASAALKYDSTSGGDGPSLRTPLRSNQQYWYVEAKGQEGQPVGSQALWGRCALQCGVEAGAS